MVSIWESLSRSGLARVASLHPIHGRNLDYDAQENVGPIRRLRRSEQQQQLLETQEIDTMGWNEEETKIRGGLDEFQALM